MKTLTFIACMGFAMPVYAEQIGQPVEIPVTMKVITMDNINCDGKVCRNLWGECFDQTTSENVDEMEQIECP